MYIQVHIGKYFTDIFPFPNDLKEGDALSSLFFNFALEYAIRKFQENKVGLKLNGRDQLLVNADVLKLLGDNISIINTRTLIGASNEICLEINTERTKYTLLSRYQNAGQNQKIKMANISFENVAPFKYVGTTVTNHNLIHDEIKSRLNSGNAY
jgi:hypothetical protein